MGGRGKSSGQDAREQGGGGGGGANDVRESAYSSGELDGVYGGGAGDAGSVLDRRHGGSSVNRDGFADDTYVDAVKAVDSMLSDFPILGADGGAVRMVDRPDKPNSMAWAYTGRVLMGGKYEVEFNKGMFGGMNLPTLTAFASTESGGFHYPNNTAGAIIAHELGHAVDAKLTRLQSGGSSWQAHDNWTKNTVAKEILTRAANRVGLASGSDISERSLLNLAKTHISGYGETNLHEALSESFGQFYALGSNASPFAKAVYDEARNMARAWS